MRTKPAITISGIAARPAPASHAPKPAKGRTAASNGAAQQIAARMLPVRPVAMSARSLKRDLSLRARDLGWIASLRRRRDQRGFIGDSVVKRDGRHEVGHLIRLTDLHVLDALHA